MKKLVFLVQEYVEGKNKAERETAQEKGFEASVKLFKEQMKDLFAAKAFKIVKEVPPDAVLIEYAEVIDNKMWEALRAADIVSIIDSIIPSDI